MRLFLLGFILLFCFNITTKAQNLVPNPSFETFSVCPSAIGQISTATPWTAATTDISSTDYYNNCSGLMSVPYNQGSNGFQYAKSGVAYSGLLFCVNSGLREYLQVQLLSPLVQNKVYNVEFFVNLYNPSSSCNNIAANLSSTRPVSSSTYSLQSLMPHIMNIGNPLINDTLNWIKVSGCYLAQGGEEYLTIGNFFDNTNTIVTGSTGVAYYYVDDVSVEEITGTCVNAVNELSANFNIELYPNPTNGILNLKMLDAGKDVEIKITDVLGREALVSDYKEQIDISHLETGIYFVSILQGNKSLVTKKVVKQ